VGWTRGLSVLPMTLDGTAALALACFAGAWLALAGWLSWRGWSRVAVAAALRREVARLSATVVAGPAAPILIARDGRLQGSVRAAAMLGLQRLPDDLEELTSGTSSALSATDAVLLVARVDAAARTGGQARLVFSPPRSRLIVRIDVCPAPPGFGAGSALLWLTDVTSEETKTSASADDATRRAGALEALTQLIEAAPFPIWHRGPDLALAMVNSAYVAAVEAESGARVVADGIELIDEADGRHAIDEAAEVRTSGAPSRRTLPATIAGERRMLRIVELPIGSSGVAGFAIDIEDEEQARAELSRFQAAQRGMLDRLSAGVAQFGRDRALDFFNQPFARLFELTPEFLSDRPEFDRVIDAMRDARKLPEPRDYPSWKAERREWFIAGGVAVEEDWELPDRRHLRVLAQPLPDGGLLVIFEDRTRQIMLESDRERMVQVQNTTFDSLAEGIAVFASNRRLKLWNDRFRALWGVEPEILKDRPLVETLASALAPRAKAKRQGMLVRDLVRGAIVSRRPRSGRLALVDGREFQLAAIPIAGEDVLFTTLDVTDSARVETALRERTAALEEADRIKTAFVSNISYELRTPLTSIAGFAEMMEAGYAGALEDSAREYVAAILASVGRLSALIDDVLDLTQSDTGGLLLAEEEVDVAEMVEGLLEQARGLADEKGVLFSSVVEPSAGMITGDRRRLGQAVINLLRNATQVAASGGSVRLTCDGDDEAARIVVADTGPGIAPADQTRIFDRFQRSSEGERGAGLGLPLARQFVEAHGGTIVLKSEVGEGAEFTISLPRTAGQRAARRAARGAAKGA
jgi:signal transduction histidine kinase